MLENKVTRKILTALLVAGSLIIVMMGFLLHYGEDDRIVWGTIDSVSYYIQAKIFSTGHINVPSHALKEFFSTGYCINDGKFYSKYFPGWPSFLSLGIILGAPWIINPFFGVASIILIYLLGKELYDRDTGLVAALLLASSSYFYILTPTYFSEPSALFFSGLFFYFMIRTIKEPGKLSSLLAGLCLGIVFLIRPYSAVAVSLPVIVYFVVSSLINKKKLTVPVNLIVMSFLPALSVFFLYNYLQTGSIFLTPFQYYNPADNLGFGLRTFDIIMDPYPYTIFNAFRNTAINLALLNLESVPLLFVFIVFVIMNKANRWDSLLIMTLVSIVFFQMFYFYREPRYYYPAFFALLLLAARGIQMSDIIVGKYFPYLKGRNLKYFIILLVVFVNIFIIITPQKLLYDYRSSRKMRGPFDTAKQMGLRNSVVFLRTVPMSNNYTALYVQNPLNFKGDTLFVKDLKDKNAELMKYYPDREFYYYDYDVKLRSGKLTKIR